MNDGRIDKFKLVECANFAEVCVSAIQTTLLTRTATFGVKQYRTKILLIATCSESVY